ncbi:hypothetical protein [Microlunatus sagamiharensis]|uniref:hypothetical protein n=1 Tax=Microlunatus sagamiharensis TaxID=546874 RepID=UPI000B84566B|nr:hypothetical protein [Microlunatus sagamiharensis]
MDRAYLRLVAETAGLVRWHFVHNPTPGAHPTTTFSYPEPAAVMPGRYASMLAHGGVQDGFLDTAIVPLVLGLRAQHVWCMEYDVDYSGNWTEVFGELASDDADLLTSTVATRAETPDWSKWPRASAPPWVDEGSFLRAFHPLMRLSRSFAQSYALMMSDRDWQGHYESTLPTAALASGARIADIGGHGSWTPDERRGRFYLNTPSDYRLSPGTLVWRPHRSHYFHERPDDFGQQRLLHHPVKADVEAWSTATMNAERPPG